MIANSDIVKRAEAIAARDGGTWVNHLDAARNEALPLQKVGRKSTASRSGWPTSSLATTAL